MELEVVTAPHVELTPPERTYLDALRRSERLVRARLVLDAPTEGRPVTATLVVEATHTRTIDALLEVGEALR